MERVGRESRSSRIRKSENLYINSFMFKRICLAAAFSPRTEALLAEACRLCKAFDARLTIIHVGKLEKVKHNFLKETTGRFGISIDQIEVVDKPGDPAQVILKTCREKNCDLLLAGALQKEELLNYYIGTVGRIVLRKAPCSVLVLTDPQEQRKGFQNIGALAEDTPFIKETLTAACQIGSITGDAQLHVLREIKMFGLTLASADQSNQSEYDQLQEQLVKDEIEEAEKLLSQIPHDRLKINFKVVSGKAGFEVSKFAQRKDLDLLVVGMPTRRFNFLDRFFKHDLEYLFADLPCNLLLIKPDRS